MTNILQTMADIVNEEGRRIRAQYHLTLGELIKHLERSSQNAPVECVNGIVPGNPHSYRGYYSDLAFELDDPTEVKLTVRAFLDTCRKVLGTTLEGYKGGEFLMGAKTPLWLSAYGDASGTAIMDVIRRNNDTVLLIVKSLED